MCHVLEDQYTSIQVLTTNRGRFILDVKERILVIAFHLKMI
jgi:hypothetical protein